MKLVKFFRDAKYKLFFVLGLIVVVVLLLDYQFCKWVPNFFFLDSFTKDNVEAYWKAIISIGTAGISLLTIFQTSDKFFHENVFIMRIRKKKQ